MRALTKEGMHIAGKAAERSECITGCTGRRGIGNTRQRSELARGRMPELIHKFKNHVESENGIRYSVVVYGERRTDGNWEGWLEFRPENALVGIRTGRETTQPDRSALAYWASGLEPIYVEGAFDRAMRAEGRGA